MRVACCPVTVHALLHIASSIRAVGPVWAYWAFPMERFCGDIQPNIRSRRHPYISINKYVTSRAQLTQIKLLYNLHEELCLQPPVSHNHELSLPSCKFPTSNGNKKAYHHIPDPSFVLKPPRISATTLHASLWKTLTATLATRFNKPASLIRKLVPKDTRVIQYGRACRLDGGDSMQARELIPLSPDSRDMSFVRVRKFSALLDNIVAHPPSSTNFLLTNSCIKGDGNLSLNSGTFLDRSSAFSSSTSLPRLNMRYGKIHLSMQLSIRLTLASRPPITVESTTISNSDQSL